MFDKPNIILYIFLIVMYKIQFLKNNISMLSNSNFMIPMSIYTNIGSRVIDMFWLIWRIMSH